MKKISLFVVGLLLVVGLFGVGCGIDDGVGRDFSVFSENEWLGGEKHNICEEGNNQVLTDLDNACYHLLIAYREYYRRNGKGIRPELDKNLSNFVFLACEYRHSPPNEVCIEWNGNNAILSNLCMDLGEFDMSVPVYVEEKIKLVMGSKYCVESCIKSINIYTKNREWACEKAKKAEELLKAHPDDSLDVKNAVLNIRSSACMGAMNTPRGVCYDAYLSSVMTSNMCNFLLGLFENYKLYQDVYDVLWSVFKKYCGTT
jgi:hypothetical protein